MATSEKDKRSFHFTVFVVKVMVIHEYGLSDKAFTHPGAAMSQEIHAKLLYLAVLMGTWSNLLLSSEVGEAPDKGAYCCRLKLRLGCFFDLDNMGQLTSNPTCYSNP